jgi:hypothetical protein
MPEASGTYGNGFRYIVERRRERKMARPADWPEDIPFIDEDVAWRAVSSLRNMTVERFHELERERRATVIHENGKPLSVMLPWPVFLEMQEAAKGSGKAVKD